MPYYYDMYFILVNIDLDQMNCDCKYYLAGKINQHGGKHNCIETQPTEG